MAGMSAHWDAVPAKVQAALRRVSTWHACEGFYLAGGTALALLEGHRASIDLDLFSAPFTDAERLVSALSGEAGDVTITSTASRTVYAVVDGVQVNRGSCRWPPSLTSAR